MVISPSPIIHLFTDFSANSVEETIARAALISSELNTNTTISTPNLARGHVIQAAVFMQMVFESFPTGTFHICHLGLNPDYPARFIMAEYQSQFILGPDIGVIPAIISSSGFDYHELPMENELADALKHIYLPIVRKLHSKTLSVADLPICQNPRKATMLTPVYQTNNLRLTVLLNDSQGNAVTNLKKEDFDRFGKGRPFKIRFSPTSDALRQINKGSFEINSGTAGAYFGPGGFLVITFKDSSAKQYLGLSENKNLLIEFQDQ